MENKITKGFHINNGLKEKCLLVITLFHIYVEDALID